MNSQREKQMNIVHKAILYPCWQEETPDRFRRRVDKFREEVIARGKPTNWVDASLQLGVSV